MTPDQEARFWSKVDKTDTCWLWTGYCNPDGYGVFTVSGVNRLAHRVSLELFLGRPLAPGMVAAHAPHSICGHRNCVNPQHISEKTHAENIADKIADGTSNRGILQPNSKLSEAQVLAIRADTRVQREIAADYGIDRVTVSEIKRRLTWYWLEDVPEASTPSE